MEKLLQKGKRLTPTEAMELAVFLGAKAWGRVAPNPLVGCLLLDKDQKLLSYGFHEQFGGPHAEINALKGLSESEIKGANLYVILEPCAHEGKTGSCAKKLATLPIEKVVYGVEDPNPQVAGRGLQILRDAGIGVEQTSPELVEACEELAEVFLFNQRTKRPFVALKVATSLDGQMGHMSGESRWITGEEARTHAHYLRAGYDAVLIGGGTFLADDPSLNIRHPSFPGAKNKVVILDSVGSVAEALEGSQLLKCRSAEDVYLVGTREVTEQVPKGFKGNLVSCAHENDSGFDLEELLSSLFERGIFSLFVEGGASVHSAFLQAKKVQRLYQFLAPTIIGGASGLAWTKELSCAEFSQRLTLRSVSHQIFGTDICVTGKL
jgi:diaminohydroxyphosphoribosylaminopyrimidine deaminase/5-amino-6-(5-phosphoribosylamino)uracil reductase